MAEETPKAPGPFDVRTVKSLVSLMTQHDLAEIDLRDGMQRLRLRRGGAAGPQVVMGQVPHALPLAAATPPPPTANAAPRTDSAPPAASAKNLLEIKSPTVGTFYAASGPDTPPFVRVGSKVTATSTVCIIEAMKIFNEIAAECAGTIVEVLVENQSPVEYGQVLFRVDPG